MLDQLQPQCAELDRGMMLGCLHGAIDIVATFSQRPKTVEIFEVPSIRSSERLPSVGRRTSLKPRASVWLRKLASAERSVHSDGPS